MTILMVLKRIRMVLQMYKTGDIVLINEKSFFKARRLYGWKDTGPTGLGVYVILYDIPYICTAKDSVVLYNLDDVSIAGVYRSPEYLSPIARERLEARVFRIYMDYSTSGVKQLQVAVKRKHKDEYDASFVKALIAADVGSGNTDILNMTASNLYNDKYEYMKRII